MIWSVFGIVLLFVPGAILQEDPLKNEPLNKYTLMGELKGTVKLPCNTKTRPVSGCEWTTTGDASELVASTTPPPGLDPRYKIIGDWQNGNCALQITDLQDADTNIFSCLYRPAKEHSSRVNLLLGRKPDLPKIYFNGKVLTPDMKTEVEPNVDVTLACNVTKGAPPVNMTWTLDQTITNKIDTVATPVGEDTNVVSTLILQLSENGPNEVTVFCNATHLLYPYSMATTSATIGLQSDTTTVILKPKEAKIGEQLTCTPNGLPIPLIEWRQKQEGGSTYDKLKKTGPTLTPSSPGVYQCFVTTIKGQQKKFSNDATVKKNGAARADISFGVVLTSTFLLTLLIGKI